jgi:hypothetical protein
VKEVFASADGQGDDSRANFERNFQLGGTAFQDGNAIPTGK